jgi:iron complex outermembrane receptor protein
LKRLSDVLALLRTPRRRFASALLLLSFVLGSSLPAWAQDLEPEQEPATEPDDLAPSEAPSEPAAESGDTAEAPAEAGAAEADAADAEASAEVEGAPATVPVAASSPDQIVVTGSRIKTQSAFAAAAPVQVIDRKQLEYSGATNLADVVSYLTVSQGSGFQGGNGAAGTTSVNLRGLGEGATLVLLNGRRLPVTGSFNANTQLFVDLSIIPLAAVERIEVLKGGASAIYGSDAVAGVVNIITRRNLDGTRLELDGQATTHSFDQKDGTVNVAWGATSERGRAMIAANYFRRTELDADQRDWTKGGYLSTQGFPGSFIVGMGTMPDPACNMVKGSMVTMGAAGGICSFQYRQFTALVGEAERGNIFGSGDYDLTNHLNVFGEVLASRLRSSAISSPAFPIPPPFPTVPANHVDNPFGQPAQFIGRPVGAEAGGARSVSDDDTIRGLLGVRGDFEDAGADTIFENWEWEVYASLASGRNRLYIPDTLRGAVQDALNSCSDPSNLSNCYNPFYSSVNGTGTPNSPSVINRFYGAQETLTDSQLQTYNAGMSGGLFELPGGDVGIAFGGEVRRERRSSQLDHEANQNEYSFLIGNPDSSAERSVYGGYLELRWPILNGVEIQTAGRVEHYTDIDKSALSPSAGLTLLPAEWVGRDNAPAALRRLQLRGHVTSAFRAPNLYQSYPGYATVPTALQTGGILPVFTPVQGFGNPDLKPEHALAISGGFSWQPIDEIALSTDVWYYDYKDRIELTNAQQIVNQWIAGGRMPDPRVVFDPTSNSIARVLTQQVNIPGDVVTDGVDFSAFVTLSNKTFGGTGVESDMHKLSFGTIGTYVLTFDYPFSEAAARNIPASPGVMAHALPPAHCTGTAPTSSCSALGGRNFNNLWPAFPRWKVNFPVTWTYLGHAASFITHYVSSVEDDVNPKPDGSFDTVSSWITFDVMYSYTIKDMIGKELTFRVGLYNIADSPPPSVNGLTTSYEITLHDPRGRMLYGKLIAQF